MFLKRSVDMWHRSIGRIEVNYTEKLTLSMVIPTVMVAGAGGSVVFGAVWLQNQSKALVNK